MKYFLTTVALLTLSEVFVFGQTIVNNFETTNPFTGGFGVGMGASGSRSLLVGGQNNQPAVANLSSLLNFNSNLQTSQFYSASMDIGIEATGTGNAAGFQVSQNGTLNNGAGPNFQFIEGHDGGSFVFSTGQQGSVLSADFNGNGWNYTSSAPQLGEIFSVNFLTEFYYPGFGNPSDRTFDYTLSVTRSDPNNLIAIDSLLFRSTKTYNPGNVVNELGQLTFRGSGVGGFRGSMDNLIMSTVPEPTTGLLAIVAGLGLLSIRRRPVQ